MKNFDKTSDFEAGKRHWARIARNTQTLRRESLGIGRSLSNGIDGDAADRQIDYLLGRQKFVQLAHASDSAVFKK